MKLKLGTAIAGLLVALAWLGALGSGVASAQVPPDPQPAATDDFAARPWLRHSIVVCAADVMNVPVAHVVYGLREGHSLKEIGIRAGVRPEVLEAGILRCERAHLARLVDGGVISPAEARRIFNFLQIHITRIINYHWDSIDEALDS